MVLRIHFAAEDLGHVRLITEADPMWELVLSLRRLQNLPGPHLRTRPHQARLLASARQRLRPGLADRLRDSAHLLMSLTTAHDFPDFITPPPRSAAPDDFATALDRVKSTPQPDLQADVRRVFREARPPQWVRRLAAGRAAERRELEKALTAYQQILLAPGWDEIADAVGAERGVQARKAADHGVGAMLTTLHPSMRWQPPVLEVRYPKDRDLDLAGRGVTLIPSFFCTGAPVTWINPQLPPVLVYPAAPVGEDRKPQSPGTCALARLLGETRAAVLQALAEPCSTTQLARRVGVSIGTASKQTAVLRDAGLATSARFGTSVVHQLTSLGQQMAAQFPHLPPVEPG
ncbi:helix-turn-helix domain-containing protein [Streptomyces sp. NPDC057654]|uniref:helix-turn-helix domain-containing protein n=1 Tax=Streptomyces sp. NPDC057654 TaxID=3346196 RepID=UPI0036BEADCE